MSELNARGVADEARNERIKMPLTATPLAAFQVEIDQATLMLMCLRMSLQITGLKRQLAAQALALGMMAGKNVALMEEIRALKGR
jgi:hypothetical protein